MVFTESLSMICEERFVAAVDRQTTEQTAVKTRFWAPFEIVSRIEKLNNNVIPTMAHANRLAILSAHESLLRRMYLNDFSSSTTSAMSLTPPTASVNTSSLSQNNVIHSNHSFLKTEDFEIPDNLIVIATF